MQLCKTCVNMRTDAARIGDMQAKVTDRSQLEGQASPPMPERLLESGLSSGDWAGAAAHNELSQVCFSGSASHCPSLAWLNDRSRTPIRQSICKSRMVQM